MKDLRHISGQAAYAHRMGISNHHKKTNKSTPLSGSLAGKFPVVLDDGRTVIYISDKSRENEIRLLFESRKSQAPPFLR